MSNSRGTWQPKERKLISKDDQVSSCTGHAFKYVHLHPGSRVIDIQHSLDSRIARLKKTVPGLRAQLAPSQRAAHQERVGRVKPSSYECLRGVSLESQLPGGLQGSMWNT
jgi:hypothetical protein